MMQNNDSMSQFNEKAYIEMLFKMVGSDCDGEVEGDYRDEEGLLVCHVCGKRKEVKGEFPYIGVRVHPTECDCQKERRRQKEEDERRRKEQEVVDELFSYSLIDDRFYESTFSNCQENDFNRKPITIAKRYVAMFNEMLVRNKGLLFYGEPGTGKTFVASCIANALLKKRVPLIVTSIIKLTNASGPFSKEVEEQQKLMRKMNMAKLLVLDDLGSERSTDFKMEQVFEVIDSRYGSKKPMIITTNLSLNQMQEETDIRRRRIYERIFEVCFPVKFAGPSWRYKTASDDYDEIKKLLIG